MSRATERRRIADVFAARAERRDLDGYFGYEDVAHRLRIEQRQRRVLAAVARAGWRSFAGRRLLDVGCGGGATFLDAIAWGAEPRRLAGIDLSAEAVAATRRRVPDAEVVIGCASELPWPDAHFDLVCARHRYRRAALVATR